MFRRRVHGGTFSSPPPLAFFDLEIHEHVALLVGTYIATMIWLNWTWLPPLIRLGLVVICVLVALAHAFVWPQGEPLLRYELTLLIFYLSPRVYRSYYYSDDASFHVTQIPRVICAIFYKIFVLGILVPILELIRKLVF